MRMRIIAVNDVYTLANMPRLATLIAAQAARDPLPRTLVTLAGDFLAPSLLSSLDAGRGMVDVMNAVGFTHVTFGNHEDDLPIDDLRARVGELDAVWLATNLPGFRPEQPESDVVDVPSSCDRVVRVALIGVVDDDPALYPHPPFGGARILPPIPTAVAVGSRLLREGCDCVIALTHLRAGEDRKLAAERIEGEPFVVLLGGHDHKPILEQVGETWLGKAGAEAVGALVVELAWGAGRRPTVDMRFEPVAGYAEDARVRALVDRHMRAVRELEAATLMRLRADEPLSSVGTRAHPTSLATVLCSAIRDAMKADVSVFNGGGIRGSRVYEQRFTYADLEREVPFDNELGVAEIPGEVLRDAIVWSRRHAPADSGGYLHTDDGVVWEDGRLAAIAGRPFEPARAYRVALIRDMLLGMDHNEPLVTWAKTHADRIPPETSGREVKLVLVEAFGARAARELGFAAIDTDHDGVLSVAEIARALRAQEREAS